jgi:hypothetical protein
MLRFILNRLFFHNPKSRFCRLDGGGAGGAAGGGGTGGSNPNANINAYLADIMAPPVESPPTPTLAIGPPPLNAWGGSGVEGKPLEGGTALKAPTPDIMSLVGGAGGGATALTPKEPAKKAEPAKEVEPAKGVKESIAKETKKRKRKPNTLLGMDQSWLGSTFVGGPRKLLGE